MKINIFEISYFTQGKDGPKLVQSPIRVGAESDDVAIGLVKSKFEKVDVVVAVTHVSNVTQDVLVADAQAPADETPLKALEAEHVVLNTKISRFEAENVALETKLAETEADLAKLHSPAAARKGSGAVVLKARALAWVGAIENKIYTRGVFASLTWLAVAMALSSTVFGSKWAAASCALSLAVLAHIGVAMILHVSSLANSFTTIQQTYRGEVQSTEKKPAEAAKPMSTFLH